MASFKRMILPVMLAFGLVSALRGEDAPEGLTQTPAQAEEVLVKARRLEDGGFTRSVLAAEIRPLQPDCAADWLQDSTSLKALARGNPAIQADLSVLGGSFDQASLCLDGFRVNDPQTGHYSLDLGVPAAEIGELKISEHPSSIAGAGGLAGTLGFKTRDLEPGRAEVRAGTGSFGTWSNSASLCEGLAGFGLAGTFEQGGSEGYHFDTDYSRKSGFLKAALGGLATAIGSYEEKDYGAFDFYTPGKGLASREYTISRFAGLNVMEDGPVGFQVYGRTHYDRFQLDESSPAAPAQHNNAAYGGVARGRLDISREAALTAAYGFDRYEVQSNTLGQHYLNRHTARLGAEYGNLAGLGGGLVKDETLGDYTPMGEGWVDFKPLDWLRAFGGGAAAVRYPTFTDLYYHDLYDLGTPGLAPEKSAGAWAGVEPRFGILTLYASGFTRSAWDLIDWSRATFVNDSGQTVQGWRSMNVGRVDASGATGRMLLKKDFWMLSAEHTYLDARPVEGYAPKYGSTWLRNHLVVEAGLNLLGFESRAVYHYQSYQLRPDLYHRLDLALSRSFSALTVGLRIENVADAAIDEIPGVPSRGRYVEGRVEMAL
jgi:iron complex outermembrane receptor protein